MFVKSEEFWIGGYYERKPARIFLTPEAEDLMDIVVVSLILVEQKRRAAETEGYTTTN